MNDNFLRCARHGIIADRCDTAAAPHQKHRISEVFRIAKTTQKEVAGFEFVRGAKFRAEGPIRFVKSRIRRGFDRVPLQCAGIQSPRFSVARSKQVWCQQGGVHAGLCHGIIRAASPAESEDLKRKNAPHEAGPVPLLQRATLQCEQVLPALAHAWRRAP